MLAIHLDIGNVVLEDGGDVDLEEERSDDLFLGLGVVFIQVGGLWVSHLRESALGEDTRETKSVSAAILKVTFDE